MQFEIRNDFHGRFARINARPIAEDEKAIEIRLSKGQVRKLRRALCPFKGCNCGAWAAQPQRAPDGRRLIIDASAEFCG